MEVKINSKEKTQFRGDTSANKDTLSKEKESEDTNEVIPRYLSTVNVWKKRSSVFFQEAFELLESLPSESNDSPTDEYSDEEVPANNLLEFSLDSEEDDEEIEQRPVCSSLYSENTYTAFLTSGCSISKVIRQWKKRDVHTKIPIFQ
ncbi:hypothetical protein TNCV_3740081 [Trichonephila clavipes]|nr:hypothetical protein TNCV_3740081 [Trichonephila clavipes]